MTDRIGPPHAVGEPSSGGAVGCLQITLSPPIHATVEPGTAAAFGALAIITSLAFMLLRMNRLLHQLLEMLAIDPAARNAPAPEQQS